jgi:hypothetical protein
LFLHHYLTPDIFRSPFEKIWKAVIDDYIFDNAQVKTNYPDIPRIYVHTHVAGDYDAIQKYLDVREILLAEYSRHLAMWINLSDRKHQV